MADKRRAEASSALLSKNGYLRLSSDLVPSDARKKKIQFIVTPLPEERVLKLRLVKGKDDGKHQARRRAMWANDAARCPMLAIRSALKFLGVKLPEKSVHYAVDKRRNGELLIQF